ncbi:hypothetical protein D3C87_07960 [compost metagenome]
MKQKFPILISLLLLFACNRPTASPTTIHFDGKTFELPIRVDQAKKTLGLMYLPYYGFWGHATTEAPVIKTQLEGYPQFMGSDNDSEESYYDHYFVGVSFMQPTKIYQNQKSALERTYGKKFILQKNYSYLETNDGLIVVLKNTALRSMPSKKYIAVSFYKGISLDELNEYLNYVEI